MIKSNTRHALVVCAFLAQTSLGLETPDEDKAKATVENFYRTYIAQVNAFIDRPADQRSKETKPRELDLSRYFTKELLRTYKKLRADPDLDYDPILQSNNVPDALKVRTSRVEGSAATIALEYVGYTPQTPLLDVRLKKQNGKWLLDGIGNLNGARNKK